MKKLILLIFVIIYFICCEDKYHCWGCTDYYLITYSDERRDTSFKKLYVNCNPTKCQKQGCTTTQTEAIGNGVTRSTEIRTSCSPIYTRHQ